MKTYLYRASNMKSTITLLALVSYWKSISGTRQTFVSCDKYIRECDNTLYVGLAHAVPQTNTKFKPLLRLKRVYRTQNSQTQNIIF